MVELYCYQTLCLATFDNDCTKNTSVGVVLDCIDALYAVAVDHLNLARTQCGLLHDQCTRAGGHVVTSAPGQKLANG